MGLTPEGFPLDAAGLVEVGLEQPLVSLDEAGRPVLAPAAVEDIARVSPELAARLEATERDALAGGAGAGSPAGSPSGDALLEPGDAGGPDPLGGTGNGDVPPDTGATALGTPGAPASPALPAGKAVPPLARPVAATPPQPAKGQKVSFRRDGVEVQGRVTGLLGNGGFIVETADDVEFIRGNDLTPLPHAPKAAKAAKQSQGTGKSGSAQPKGPPPPRPAPFPPVVVNGKTLPTPEWVRENHGNKREPPMKWDSRAARRAGPRGYPRRMMKGRSL